MRILVIAAHPDDEILGCGGTCARYAKEGAEIYFSILGEGISSRYDERGIEVQAKLVQLASDCQRASQIIGARSLKMHNLQDNRFDRLPLLDIIKIVEEDIKEIKPEIIYTHHSGDLNIDHRITFRAVLTAVRPAVASTVRELYAFEIPSSTDWAFGSFEPVFRPNTFVDISGELETKLEALSGYSSEVRNFPHPRSLEAVRAKAKSWGSIIGCEAGEAFELIFSLNRKS